LWKNALALVGTLGSEALVPIKLYEDIFLYN